MRRFNVLAQPAEGEYESLVSHIHSRVAASVYYHRGIKSVEQFDTFTRNSSTQEIPDLHDMVKAEEVLSMHLKNGSKIAVYGDYDADGAVAASILWRFLSRELNANCIVYIPDRHEEGYGLNKEALEKLAADGFGLIITVDCGVRDGALIENFTAQHHVDIIVTDHHQPGETFPSCPTVHPLFPSHVSKNPYTSGGVVAWQFVRFIEQKLGMGNSYSQSVIDLAGISLITDIMPLKGSNRSIVKQALQKIRVQPQLGVKAILDVVGIPQGEIATYHLGYVIGPRLNASGRIGNQYTSTRLLSTDNQKRAQELAIEVNEINIRRQDLTKVMLAEAEKQKKICSEKILVTYGESWDDGIIGLVAGRLMNTYDLPTIAIAVDIKKGSAKGSARSFGTFNITLFLESVKDQLSRFGGHSNAAGFSLKTTDIQSFLNAVNESLQNSYADFIPVLTKSIDAELSVSDLTDDFFVAIGALEPFGPENSQPNFVLRGKVAQFTTIGKLNNHLRIEVETLTGTIKAMYFDAVDKVGKLQQGMDVILLGRPKKELYNGYQQITFMVDQLVDESDLQSVETV